MPNLKKSYSSLYLVDVQKWLPRPKYCAGEICIKFCVELQSQSPDIFNPEDNLVKVFKYNSLASVDPNFQVAAAAIAETDPTWPDP